MYEQLRDTAVQRRQIRLRLLYQLYVMSEGILGRAFRADALGTLLATPPYEVRIGLRHLEQSGLVRLDRNGTLVALTDGGLTRLRNALLDTGGRCTGFPSLVEAGILTADQLTERRASLVTDRARSLLLLCEIYQRVDGDPDAAQPIVVLQDAFRHGENEFDRLIEQMEGVYLLTRTDREGVRWVSLTPSGLFEVERALAEPDQPSSLRFPSLTAALSAG